MKKLKRTLREVISKVPDKEVSWNKDDECFRVFIKVGESREDDPNDEEVWESDVEIKVFKENYYWGEKSKYHIKVNDDKLKNYKDGVKLFKDLEKKYKNKKKSLRKEKISRIINKLENV